MDVKEKYQIVEKIIQTNDEHVLREIKELLGLSGDFWSDLPNEVKSNIDLAKKELVSGEGLDHDSVMKDIRDRFFK